MSGSDDGSSALDVAGTPSQRNRVDTDLTRVRCNEKNQVIVSSCVESSSKSDNWAHS